MVKKKDEGQGGNGVPASRSPPVYLFAQVLKVPCIALSHTSLHAPYINWGPHHCTRTPFLPLQHLLPLSFIFCSKLPAVTFSGLWGQLPNPASPLARYAGLVRLTPCSVGPEESGVGDTWGQLRVPVLTGHLGQATYLQ